MPEGFVSFAAVKQAVRFEALLDRYELLTGLTKKGQNLAGPCPFCKGMSSRQFQVNLAKSAWYCFGCKAGGNILDFVVKKEGLTVREAAITLDRWFKLGLVEGVAAAPQAAAPEVPRETPEDKRPSENAHLTFSLKTLDPSHAALAPLGLRAETLTRFGAGFCTKGFLKGRLAVPIHNTAGELIAYAGLALQATETPRYLFPPNFYPALEVMNLHRLAEFVDDGPLYLASEIEGALRLVEAGETAVLGLFDGSLSREQEAALQGVLRLFDELVLVGDGFAERTVARLTRYISVRSIPCLAGDDEPGEEFSEAGAEP
jgi:DNA primase